MRKSIVSIAALLLVGCQEYNLNGPEPADAPPLDEPVGETGSDAGPATSPGESEAPIDEEAPVALCSVSPDPVAALYETATWIGAESYDPSGRPLTYDWLLVSIPNGSQPATPSGGPNQSDRPGFMPDLVGIYTGQLIVTNDLGIASEPCLVDLEAIPATDLWVEMFWDHNGDDMDLHLVRDTGSLRSQQDCHFSNCRFWGLQWGPAGDAGDPRLDIDDIGGRGPENINVQEPEDLTYEVFVHDYPDSRYQPANDVTVNIYLSGSLAFSEVRAISGEDHDEHFATVDWTTQSVIPR